MKDTNSDLCQHHDKYDGLCARPRKSFVHGRPDKEGSAGSAYHPFVPRSTVATIRASRLGTRHPLAPPGKCGMIFIEHLGGQTDYCSLPSSGSDGYCEDHTDD